MKKTLLLLIVILILPGCSVERIDTQHFSDVMNKILALDINYQNKVSDGYNYYVPKSVIRVDSNSYNDVLKSEKNTYYLYADVVSYYYKTEVNYAVKDDIFYSSIIDNKEKKGYLEIIEKDDKLFVQMYYNYAKIETYTTQDKLNETIINLSYILSSVKFNDSLLKKEYGSSDINLKEETFSLFKDKEKEGNFLEYIKEYDRYDGTQDDVNEEAEIIVEDNITTSNSE